MFISRLDEYDYTLPANDEWTAIKVNKIVTELSRRTVGGIKEKDTIYICSLELTLLVRNIKLLQ